MTWKAIGVSVIGTSHTKVGKPCQDSSGIEVLDKDVLIGIVADGLGSAERSEVGSALVVETVMKALKEGIIPLFPDSDLAWQELMQNAFKQARGVLENKAQELNCPLRELGTTLICFMYAPGTIAIGQIGDGAVVIQFEDNSLITVSSPQRGEFANETVPLTMDNALERVFYHVQPAQAKNIAAFSDGLQNLALISMNYQPFEPFFTPLFNLITNSEDLAATKTKLADFLGSEKVTGRTDDDKTLLLAHFAEEPVQEEKETREENL